MRWRSIVPALFPAAGSLLLGGCVSSSDIEGLHRHVSNVEKKVDAVAAQASSREEVQKLNENLAKQSSALLRSNAEIGTKFDDLIREMQNLAGKLEDVNRRFREVSQQLAELQARAGAASGGGPTPGALAPAAGAVAGAPAGAAGPAAGAGGASPGGSKKGGAAPDLYAQATADYQRGQFDLARQGFQEYLGTFPKTDLSDDAAYWIGECYAAQKKPREAIAAWERLFKQYSESEKAPAAHLKKGLAHLDLGEKAQAIVELQFVVHEYPRSDEAKSARQRLRTLGADVR